MWHDLTIADAGPVADFYAAVVGWKKQPVPMDGGSYEDYGMGTPDGEAAGGVCHARGPNVGIPPQWMMYVSVADLEGSLAAVEAHGGRVVRPPPPAGAQWRFAVIADPSGAVLALMEMDKTS